MEGMFLHGAAHIFFENKLAETESNFNIKFKKFEQMFRDELKEMAKLHASELRKVRNDVKLLRIEVSDIKKSEEDLSIKGMDKISKLSKEVKTEVNEMKKIKTEVNQLKKEVCGIRQSEEDLTNIGKDSISRLNEEFKNEVKKIKAEIKTVKKDVGFVKELRKTKKEKEKEKDETEKEQHTQYNDEEYVVVTKPICLQDSLSTIIEHDMTSDEEFGRNLLTNNITSDEEYHIKNEILNESEKTYNENDILKANVNYIKYEHPVYNDEDMKMFNDDHIRRLVFSNSSQESSDDLETEVAGNDENPGKLYSRQK